MKKLLCTIQDTSQMIQIQKRLDQNHINYFVEPIKSNFLSVSGIEHKSESGVYVEKDSYETAKKIVQDIA